MILPIKDFVLSESGFLLQSITDGAVTVRVLFPDETAWLTYLKRLVLRIGPFIGPSWPDSVLRRVL